MKKINRVLKKVRNSRGIALILGVFFLFIISILLTLPILVRTNYVLTERNLTFAIRMARNYSTMGMRYIRGGIDEQIYNQMQTQLRDHLRKAQLAKQGRGSYPCQDTVNGEGEVSQTWAICDPVHLLDDLKGAQNQTIDDLSVLKGLVKDPQLFRTPEWQAVERQSFNRFDYTLKPVFVGQELVSPGTPRRGAFPPRPRVERYRYNIKADILMRVYDDVRYRMVAYYDVVISMASYDESILCGGGGRLNPGFAPPGRAVAIAYCESDLTIPAFDPACKKTGMCVASEECYEGFCQGGEPGKLPDTCKIQGEANCEPQDGMIVGCSVSVNGKSAQYFGTTTNKTYASNGCASLGASSNGGFIWNTAIRIVSFGTAFD
ncbi:MAG: hypothetical protein AB1489_38260 [Acidobacteriota bacterium]